MLGSRDVLGVQAGGVALLVADSRRHGIRGFVEILDWLRCFLVRFHRLRPHRRVVDVIQYRGDIIVLAIGPMIVLLRRLFFSFVPISIFRRVDILGGGRSGIDGLDLFLLLDDRRQLRRGDGALLSRHGGTLANCVAAALLHIRSRAHHGGIIIIIRILPQHNLHPLHRIPREDANVVINSHTVLLDPSPLVIPTMAGEGGGALHRFLPTHHLASVVVVVRGCGCG
mmetsp:Transcript_9380/g.22884  ORF Transcript_9380/g.22884 Transcript_9380/m.22884 type:complete len:226 (-) Transcript_9380:183-860(-)